MASSSSSASSAKYVYHPPTVSIFFTKLWKPMYQSLCPLLFPDWLHANMVTALGLVFALAHAVVLGVHSAWFSTPETIPSSAYYTSAACFMMYMICDNCDGIQARRLRLSSPVGELLDHGADALVTLAGGLVVAFCYVGETPEEKQWYVLLVLSLFAVTFWCTHVLSIIEGNLFLGFRYLSIDEIWMLHAFFLLLEGYTGGRFSAMRVQTNWEQLPSVRVSAAILALVCVANVVAILKTTWSAMRRFRTRDLLFNIVAPIAAQVTAMFLLKPQDAHWFFQISLTYGLISISLILRHMNEPPIRWRSAFAAILIVRTAPAWLPVAWLPGAWPAPDTARHRCRHAGGPHRHGRATCAR